MDIITVETSHVFDDILRTKTYQFGSICTQAGSDSDVAFLTAWIRPATASLVLPAFLRQSAVLARSTPIAAFQLYDTRLGTIGAFEPNAVGEHFDKAVQWTTRRMQLRVSDPERPEGGDDSEIFMRRTSCRVCCSDGGWKPLAELP